MGPLTPNDIAGPKRSGGYARVRGVLGRVEGLAIGLGAVAVLLFGAYITTGIVFRSFLGRQIYDEVVIVGELMVAALILPLAYVAADRGFIAVEVLTTRFPRKAQIWLNVLTALVGLVATVPIAWAGWLSLQDAVHEGSYYFGLLEFPEWPGRLAFFVGYLLFVLRVVDLLVHDVLAGLGVIDTLSDPAENPTPAHSYENEDPS